MKLSYLGNKINRTSGIGQLMKDLGQALAGNSNMLMLGGGNPAHIPEVQQVIHDSIQAILSDESKFKSTIGDYDPPEGNIEFATTLSSMLNAEFGWGIGPENIALTNGSQSAFFILFNIFAGKSENGTKKKILLPLSPEYIGYTDTGVEDDIFVSSKPKIEYIDDRIFKYHVDFDNINITDEIGAICVSRPTNPTGNVLTDEEISKLNTLANEHNIPLIVDNAYGTPFPDIIFTDAKPIWDKNTIVCMSLSKFGLPTFRTGIIIAQPEVISLVSEMNAVMCLAPGGFGPALTTEIIKNGQLTKLSRETIQPFYKQKADYALGLLREELAGTECMIHKPEGAIFFWLWMKDSPITDIQLYERLKKRNVLVVAGSYFFPGLADKWQHRHECIRINYARQKETVTEGLKIIADEIKQAYAK